MSTPASDKLIPETVKFHTLQRDAAEVLRVSHFSDKELLDRVSAFLPQRIESLFDMALFLELMSRLEKVFPRSNP